MTARLVTMDNFLRQTAAGRAAATHSPESQAPPTLDGFRTGRLLGVGGSAKVWLVEDQRTGAARALKVMSSSSASPVPETGGGNEQRAELHREGVVLGSLNHPHLLRFHGVVSTDRGQGLLMDYAGGGSLLNLVTARGRLSIGECVTVLTPIAQALSYLHAASVQHGDVSPGNILFTAEGKPLLADLGVGRLLGEAAARGAGTAGFAEAVRATGLSAGFASDVYALAAIGWYSLTGSPPDRAKDRVPLTLLVPGVPPELLHILEAGLREDPGDRPSATEVAEAVLRSAEPQPLDLVAVVHPSILPELLTRRATAGEVRDGRRRFSGTLKRFRLSRSTTRGAGSRTGPEQSGRRSARLPSRARTRWRRVVPQAVAALLVLCGTLLIASQTFTGTDPARQPAVAGATEGSADPAPGKQLSPEMRERLADTDPVRALSALVGVRAMALTTGEAGLLSIVNVEESEAMDADRNLVSGLRERGVVFNGLSIRLQEAAPTRSIAVPEGAAAVRATAVMSGYTELDSAGKSARQVAQSTPQELVFVLLKEEGKWKIASVHTADAV